MKEYIERESVSALVKEIKRNFNPIHYPVIDAFIYYVDEKLPIADVAPIVHGEWIHKNGEMHCSVCGNEALMDEVYYKSLYCPDCGAKMDGGNK